MRIDKYLQFATLNFGYLFLIEGLVEGKSVIFDILSNAIHFVLWLVYFYLGVCTGNRIDLTALFFFFEDGSFSNTDCKLDQIRRTLSSAFATCGASSFYLNLFFSIINSKSMSTFLPL